jgi:hypothetical protein
MKRIILLLSIFFDAAFMLALTPVVVILGGVFQTLDEWRDSIREWGGEWKSLTELHQKQTTKQ